MINYKGSAMGPDLFGDRLKVLCPPIIELLYFCEELDACSMYLCIMFIEELSDNLPTSASFSSELIISTS